MGSKHVITRRGQTVSVVTVGIMALAAIALALWALRGGGQIQHAWDGVTPSTGYVTNQLLLPGVDYVVSSPTLVDVNQGQAGSYAVIIGPSRAQKPSYDNDRVESIRARGIPVTATVPAGVEFQWRPVWGTSVLRGRFPRPPTKRTSGGGNGMVEPVNPVNPVEPAEPAEPASRLTKPEDRTLAVFNDGDETTFFFWNPSDTNDIYVFTVRHDDGSQGETIMLKSGEYVRIIDDAAPGRYKSESAPKKMTDAPDDTNGTASVIREFQEWCVAAGWPKPPGPPSADSPGP